MITFMLLFFDKIKIDNFGMYRKVYTKQVNMNITNLPKELQIMVYEFNPEHRPHMREVCAELQEEYEEGSLPFLYEENEDDGSCAECGIPYNDNFEYKEESYGEYVLNCCSGQCWWSVTYDIRHGR